MGVEENLRTFGEGGKGEIFHYKVVHNKIEMADGAGRLWRCDFTHQGLRWEPTEKSYWAAQHCLQEAENASLQAWPLKLWVLMKLEEMRCGVLLRRF